jgi:hypothetical protein
VKTALKSIISAKKRHYQRFFQKISEIHARLIVSYGDIDETMVSLLNRILYLLPKKAERTV